MRGKPLIVLAGLLAMAPMSFGDDARLDGQELAFLRQRASNDVYIWKLAEYASEHGSTDAVKQLGKDVVQERRTDLRDIEQLSQDHKTGVDQPKDMSLTQRNQYKFLTGKSGLDFDRGFTKAMVQEYGVAVPQMDREGSQAAHDAVRDYAKKNGQMFKDHQKQARDAEKLAWGT